MIRLYVMNHLNFQLCFYQKFRRFGIMLPKLFCPTVRKNCSSDREKTFEIRDWRPRICKIFEITRTIYSNSERPEQFFETEYFNFFTCNTCLVYLVCVRSCWSRSTYMKFIRITEKSPQNCTLQMRTMCK